ncbi:uncharacterized protein LOC118198292 [Stegodyphus dumicola]|uniref:uncharacterized protein LOC118198292 n=1 Tax=Stegodyphus dumicola TaxID=202533 RepID=UPI0015B2D694|nr:uncharacterized protein LOC118198292 [Stegodyphus dumicola]
MQRLLKANRELNLLWKIMRGEEVRNLFGNIKWKFIVEIAAWWGDFWERLVRSVKTSLKRLLGRTSVSFQELGVILIETEAVINSRHLTCVFSDPNEREPLTPGYFLIGRRLLTLPQGTQGIPFSESQLLKMRRYQDLLNRIWKRWKASYFLELRSAHQSRSVNRPEELPENTVVLIKDDNAPRLVWRMGIVTELRSGRDGRVRACTERLSNGTLVRRPVQLLCALELLVNT